MSGPFHVMIAGDGVAGALAAAVLATRLPARSHKVTLVPSVGAPDDTLGRVEPSLPSIRRFHAEYGIEEQELIRAGASFALGSAFSGWSRSRPTYFLPFGDTGAPLNGVAFHQIAERVRANGQQLSLGDYSIAAMLAQTGRFAHPSNDPRTPLSTYTYALHLDVAEYRGHLLGIARRRGVAIAAAPVVETNVAQDGSLAAVQLQDGNVIAADFFIDCTGSSAQLLSRMPRYERLCWRRWFPNDRSVELLTRTARAPAPYSHLAREEAGPWSRVVPSASGVSELRVYAAATQQPDQAEAALIENRVGEPAGEPAHRQLNFGRASVPWLGNCLALGSAAARIEPTAATDLHLIHSGLERLLQLFPRSRDCGIEAREYVRAQTLESDRCRDFALLPHRLCGALAEGPRELEDKIEQFRSRGHVGLLDGDIFEEQDWASVFDGHGLRQRRYDLLADAIPIASLHAQLARMRHVMLQAVAGVPSHAETLDRIRRRTAA